MATETKTPTREYVRPMPSTWWLQRPGYIKFMVREVSSVFIAAYCVFLLILMYRAEHASPQDFQAFYAQLTQPLSLVLHLVALVFAVFHSVTFFNLTPKVLIVRQGEERVPDAIIAGVHYVAWAVVTVLVVVLALVL